ncbi:MAG TPA: glyoxalase [Cyanobacteria bacterium UBA8553]|nr:glyoxalase [Cyanobacteria bacterium UBA8553]HAJ59355.1 glyoxalase [Cyanobacteria bacterium UBA8543]
MTFRCSDAFVTLAVADIETLVRFYTQLLNQQPKSCIPNVYAEFQLPGLRLGLFKPKENHLVEFENSAHGGMSLCLEVEDLEEAITLTGFLRIAHLTSLGYPPPGKMITASHGREIYAFDPARNRLILHQSKSSTDNE